MGSDTIFDIPSLVVMQPQRVTQGTSVSLQGRMVGSKRGQLFKRIMKYLCLSIKSIREESYARANKNMPDLW
jgi:hypothetical protein